MKKFVAGVAIVIVGLWLMGGTSAFAEAGQDTKQAPPAAAQDKDKAKEQPAADQVSGEWDGVVESPDGAIQFSLKLKLEKDKVTGEVGSPQGSTPIIEGAWADGKMTIAFTYVDGTSITMTGAVADGQMSGSLNYGGQAVMNWAARKRAAK